MAQTEHLPIYKRTYDLCLYFEQVVRNFSRYHKYSLGADLRDGARKVLKLVVRANSRRDKAPVLLAVREELEELKAMLRLCQDVKAFPNFNSFGHAIEMVTEIRLSQTGYGEREACSVGFEARREELFPVYSQRDAVRGPGPRNQAP